MLAKIAGKLAVKLLTEKVIIKVSIILLERLVKSTKTTLDDALMETVKTALGE